MITPSGDEYPVKINFTNCDKEPIHLITTSQAHWVIVVCDREDHIITHCS